MAVGVDSPKTVAAESPGAESRSRRPAPTASAEGRRGPGVLALTFGEKAFVAADLDGGGRCLEEGEGQPGLEIDPSGADPEMTPTSRSGRSSPTSAATGSRGPGGSARAQGAPGPPTLPYKRRVPRRAGHDPEVHQLGLISAPARGREHGPGPRRSSSVIPCHGKLKLL